jgi:proline iminopeptidase
MELRIMATISAPTPSLTAAFMKSVRATGVPLGARIAAGLVASLGAYALVVRPRLVRWGATDAEVAGPYPGAEIIPGGQRSSSTMAVTIDAPPSDVWPWLVQMGCGRAGWYSWDHLDNWSLPSAERVHPEWQHVATGDRLPAVPDGSLWWEVAALEPEHFLGLRMSLDLRGRPFDPEGPRPSFSTDSLWGFLLEELPGRRTRLVVSGYWALEPRWLQPVATVLLYEPSHVIMQRRQFETLKKRAAAAAMGAPAASSQTTVRPDAQAGGVGSVVGASA